MATTLLWAAACTKSDDAWQEAVRTDTPDTYEAFLERHPRSEFAEQARTRRDALIDERDWSAARRAASAEGYAKYLSVHPEGVWSELAARRRNELLKSSPAPVETPVVPAPPPAAVVATTETLAQRHYLQIGAFASAASAKKSWARLQPSFGELANLKPLIDQKPLKGSSLYRLRLALETQEEADQICAALLRGGAECIKSEEP